MGEPTTSTPAPLPPLPAGAVAVAVLAIVGGASAAWDMFVELQTGAVNLNLAVVCLPLGIGVLLRSNTSRVLLAACALLVLVLMPLAMCLGMVLAAQGNGTLYVSWAGRRIQNPTVLHLAVAMVLVLAMWLFVYWAYRTLRSDRTRAAFGLDPRTQI